MQVAAAKDLLQRLFKKAGLDDIKNEVVSQILIEGELLGHRTHGLHLVKPYVEHLLKKSMESQGHYTVLNQTGAAELWNGNYLPGCWLVAEAIAQCKSMASTYGTGTVVIQKSSHIACLAAYLEEATKDGHLILIYSSDPGNKTVAPFGGTKGLYSPNPLAMGIPTSTTPILIDISMSTTSNGLVNQQFKNQAKLPHHWLLKASGETSNEPADFFTEPPATILPLGGTDSGYKGFALGLMIEAMTAALGGFGRSDNPERWGAGVFVQAYDLNKFSGQSSFLKEIDYFKNQCLKNEGVRMPGERGLALKNQQMQNGLMLRHDTMQLLEEAKAMVGIE